MRKANAETIAAASTAPGRSAIGIIRVSGPATRSIAHAVTGKDLPPRTATLSALRGSAGEVVDRGIALFFPGPESYTGEDVAEFHGHGNPVILASILGRCVAFGARHARPGEFTERAFLAGKMDLAQAEAVADLIEASSAAAAQAALRSLSGSFSAAVSSIADQIRDLRVLLEAAIDFPEEDLDVIAVHDVRGKAGHALENLEGVVAGAQQGRLLAEGLQIVLAGAPNVGKSSLMNVLTGEDLAIVTDVPGTTRDALRATVVLGGIGLQVTDTAGLRFTDDPVERIGVERTRAALGAADLALVVIDHGSESLGAMEYVRQYADLPARVLLVRNKIDLRGDPPSVSESDGYAVVSVSARTGEGIPLLKQEILRTVGWAGGETGGLFSARRRHVDALLRAQGHLEQAVALLGDSTELVAEELRYAERALDDIFGWRSPDDLLGDVFSRFCIGK